MLPLARPTLDYLALGAAAGAVLALLLALAAHLRVRRLRRSLAVLDGPHGRESVLEAVSRQVAEMHRVHDEVVAARAGLERTRAELAGSLRHVAVVRYDAFEDMGGRLSFSAALLDDAGDGLVITAINGRTETRSYAKGLSGRRSEQALSPEEEAAIEQAMSGAPRATAGA